MAALMRRQIVHISQNQSDFLGVSAAEEEGNFVVTFAKGASHIVDVRYGKKKTSWFLTSGSSICHKILFDPNGKKYITLLEENEIRRFGEGEKIEKAEKITSRVSVHSILVSEDDKPFIVTTEAKICKLDELTTTQDNRTVKDTTTISASLVKSGNRNYIPIIKETGNRMILQIFDSTNIQSPIAECTLETKNSVISSTCAVSDTRSLKVYILFANGIFHCSTLFLDSKQLESRTLPHITNTGSDLVKIYSVADYEHVLVSHMKKEKNSDEIGIGIWNANFGTLQSWIQFGEKQNDCVSTVEEHVFLFSDGQVRPHMIRFGTSSLIDAIGKSTKSNNTSLTSNTMVSWSCYETGTAETKRDKSKVYFNNLDLAINPNLKKAEFTAAVKQFTDSLQSNVVQSKIILLQPKVDKIWHRFLEEEDLIIHPASIERLLAHGVVTHNLLPGIVKKILLTKDMNALRRILEFQSIPEQCLVQILAFLFELDQENNHEHSAMSDKVFMLPYSDVFLLEKLRDLNFDTVLKVLQYFMEHLTSSEKPDQSNQAQMVDWLNLVIDAHFTQLVLSPDAHPLLIKLHEVVVKEVQYFDEYIQLEAILAQLKEKCALPKKREIGMYCIEVLEL